MIVKFKKDASVHVETGFGAIPFRKDDEKFVPDEVGQKLIDEGKAEEVKAATKKAK